MAAKPFTHEIKSCHQAVYSDCANILPMESGENIVTQGVNVWAIIAANRGVDVAVSEQL